jgi:hypothetical protein
VSPSWRLWSPITSALRVAEIVIVEFVRLGGRDALVRSLCHFLRSRLNREMYLRQEVGGKQEAIWSVLKATSSRCPGDYPV